MGANNSAEAATSTDEVKPLPEHDVAKGESCVTNRRGMHMFRQAWKAEKPNGHAVVIVHGFSEHMGRYKNVAAALNAAGYDVYGMDNEGHGRTEGERTFFPDIWELVEDLLQFVRDVSANYGGKVLAIGHSMGSTFLTLAALKAPELFHGVVLSGPSVCMDPEGKKWVIFLKIFKSVAGWMPKKQLPPVEAHQISRSTEVHELFKSDPLNCKEGLRLLSAVAILAGLDYIEANIGSFSLPLLLQHGTKDELVKPYNSEWMIPLVASASKEAKMYEDWGHEVYNECHGGADLGVDFGVETDPVSGLTTNRAVRDAIIWLNARVAEA